MFQVQTCAYKCSGSNVFHAVSLKFAVIFTASSKGVKLFRHVYIIVFGIIRLGREWMIIEKVSIQKGSFNKLKIRSTLQIC